MEDDVYNLSDGIDVGNGVSKNYINKWNTVVVSLERDYITSEKTIGIVEAEKYRGDLEGLLLSIGVLREFIYPHIRVNGYISSRDYKCETKVIKIIDPRRLFLYREMFKKL